MNGTLKKILMPLRPLWVAFKARSTGLRMYWYDYSRYVKYAGAYHRFNKTAALSQMIMAYHVLEKGLTMPKRHLDFGHGAVNTCIDRI